MICSSTSVEGDARKPPPAGHSSQAPDAATHRGAQRNWHPLDAGQKRGPKKDPTRVRGSRARRVCPRVCKVAEVVGRHRDPEKRDPAGNGTRERGSSAIGPEGSMASKVTRARHGGDSRKSSQSLSRTLERALRGKGSRSMEGIADRHPPHSVHALAGERSSGSSPAGASARELRALQEGSDSDARGTARTHRNGKTTPAAASMRPAEANRLS